MFDDKIRPTPEVVHPEEFQVREVPRGGHTSRASKEYASPFDDSWFGRAIRLHEYLHLGLSPDSADAKRWGIEQETLLAVEDARVNEGGIRFGFEDLMLGLDDPAVNPPHPTLDFRRAVLFLVASHGTGAFARTEARLMGQGDRGRNACRISERALSELTRPEKLPGFDATVAIAKWLDRVLGKPIGPGPTGHACGSHVCGIADRLGDGEPSGIPLRGEAVSPGWGALRRVDEPPRSVSCRDLGPSARRRPRAVDEGDYLRFPHRLLVDQRVFARRSRLPGGTVLIDASGSMRLLPEHLLRVVESAAGATVACYDGAREGWGEIRILARGGKRVADRLVAAPTGRGGNVVDGPALRWLSTRPSPRIWVSDGVVTGIGDAGSPVLKAEAMDICRRSGIAQVKDVPEACKLLGEATLKRGVVRAVGVRLEGVSRSGEVA